MERTTERLKELQALPLERKVGFSVAKIVEWYTRFNGMVYVAFSGGKDSTVLLYLVRKLYPDVPAVFNDTRLEYPEVRNFVNTFDNVVTIRPAMSYKEVIEKYGYPVISKEVSQCIYEGRNKPTGLKASRFISGSKKERAYNGRYSLVRYKALFDSELPISDRCCDILKKNPTKQYEKRTGRKGYTGVMAAESQLRASNWLRHGCNAFDAKRPLSNPLSFWTDQDILQYIRVKNIPIAPLYGDIVDTSKGLVCTGAQRTGCMFCLFGIHMEKEPNRIQRMYYSHPQLYSFCLDTLRLKQALDSVGVPYAPVPVQRKVACSVMTTTTAGGYGYTVYIDKTLLRSKGARLKSLDTLRDAWVKAVNAYCSEHNVEVDCLTVNGIVVHVMELKV